MSSREKGGKIAATATVGEKGQIVIPKAIRDMFGINPGDTLLLLADKKRGIAIPPQQEFKKIHSRIFGEEE